MNTYMKVEYIITNTPYGPCKRQRWRCTRCNRLLTRKYLLNCPECGAAVVGVLKEDDYE